MCDLLCPTFSKQYWVQQRRPRWTATWAPNLARMDLSVYSTNMCATEKPTVGMVLMRRTALSHAIMVGPCLSTSSNASIPSYLWRNGFYSIVFINVTALNQERVYFKVFTVVIQYLLSQMHAFNLSVHNTWSVSSSTGQFLCAHGKKCIDQWQVCDGVAQCQDRSDELDCLNSMEGCTHHCDKTRCLPDTFLCDGERDCLDGTDEANCGKFNFQWITELGLCWP